MQDTHKTKKELINELSELRLKIERLDRAQNEYVQTENILKAREKKYRTLVEVSSDFIFELDREGNYLFISPGVKYLLSYEPHEMLGKSALDFMPPQEAIRVGKAYSEFVKSKAKVFNFEHLLLHKNGREVIVESNGLPVTDETGKILGYRVISRDITKRKQAEENIRKQALMIDQVYDSIISTDLDGNVSSWNKGAEKMFGYSANEALGRHISFIYPDDQIGVLEREIITPLKQKGEHEAEVKLKRKSGQIFYGLLALSLIKAENGTVIGMLGSTMDITERKIAEKALRESESFNRAAIDHSPLGVSVRSRTGQLRYCNDTWKKLWLKTDEMIRDDITRERAKVNFSETDNYLGEWQTKVRDIYDQGGYLHIPETAYVKSKNGGILWVSQYFYAIKDDRGKVDRVVILTENITERKLAEKALRESEAHLALAQKIAHIGSWDWNLETNKHYWSDEVFPIYGLKPQEREATLELVWEVIHPDDKDDVVEAVEAAREQGIPYNIEYRVILPNGNTRFINGIGKPVRNEAGKVIRINGTSQDITKSKLAEKALRESMERLKGFDLHSTEGVYRVDITKPVPINLPRAEIADWINKYAIVGEANDSLARMYGLKPKDMIGKPAVNFAPDYGERTAIVLEKDGCRVINQKTQDIDKDGKVLYLLENYHGIVESGHLLAIWGAQRNITELKLAEKALRESEEKYRAIVTAFDGLIYTCSQNYRIEFINQNYIDKLGFNPTGQLCYKALQNRDDICPWCVNEKVLRGETVKRERKSEKDGQWYDITNTPIHHADDSISKQSLIIDITNRKLAEEKLRKEKEFSENLIQSSPAFFVALSAEGKILMMNNVMLKALGYSRPEVIGIDYLNTFVPEQEHEKLSEIFRILINSRHSTINENHMLTKDGRSLLVEWHGSQVYKENGEYDFFFGLGIDITERKLVEETLVIERRRLADILKGTNVGTWEWNVQTGETIFNERWAEIIGYTLAEIFPISIDTWRNFAHPDDLKKSNELLDDHFRGGLDYYECEVRLRHKNGNWVWVLDRGKVATWTEDGEPLLMAGTNQDITERKRTEEALKESEDKFRLLTEQSLMAIGIIQDGVYKYINRAYEEMSGYSADEIKTWKPFELIKTVHPDDRDFVIEQIKKKQTGHPEITPYYSFKGVKKNGDIIHLDLYSKTVIYQNRPADLITLVDITERKKAVEALRESEEKLRRILNSSPDAIIVMDLFGKIINCNPPTSLIYGYSKEELIGAEFKNLVSPSYRRLILEYNDKCTKRQAVGKIECMSLRKDGGEFPADLSASIINDAAGNPQFVMAIIRDLTEQKKLEAQLIHSQKMESVGRLAGGVAHDFNNLLTAIIGHSELIEAGMKADDPLIKDIKVVQQASERAAQLTSQLLAFSRKQTLQPKIVDLNQIIDNMLIMLKRIIGENIDFDILMADDIWTIKVDPGQIEQVIVNLAVNARDAIQSGGRLTIKTRNIDLEENINQAGTVIKTGKYVLLSVNDTGSGMSAEVKANIFEPFFTTKKVGKGTGLGLSTVYGIIRQSGGYIVVDSEPGAGTTFNIYLPAVKGQIDMSDTTLDTSEIPKGNETILIVEDDEIVRGIAAETLKRIGFNVIEAGSGEYALSLCSRLDKPVDLVITDVIMPNMSGPKFIENLKNIWPEFKKLYISGYSEIDLIDQSDITHYLQKPFHPKSLALKVRQVLDFQNQDSLEHILNRKVGK